MNIPREMTALIQRHDGFSNQPMEPEFEALAPYVELAKVPVPAPGEEQVLVKVTMASVNPSDIMFIKGMYGMPRKKGVPAGFEGVGEVVAGNGEPAGRLAGKRVAFSTMGAWAEYVVVDAAGCIPLLDGVRNEDGAAMIVNPLTAIAMFEIVRAEGEKAFVMTAGGSQLCKLIAGVARDAGFRPISIVRRDEQIEPLKKLGAAHVLNAGSAEYEKALDAVFREEKPRILLDAVTGSQASHIFRVMPRRARWIIYGQLDPAPPVIEVPGQLIFMQKRIEGFWLSRWMRDAPADQRKAAASEVQKRFVSGEWRTDVTASVPIGEAIGRLAKEYKEPDGKVFIVP